MQTAQQTLRTTEQRDPASQLVHIGRRPGSLAPRPSKSPDWVQASPAWIDSVLAETQKLPTGGWYALDGLNALGDEPRGYVLAGRELVAWRDAQGKAVVAPAACPHMGANLATGHVKDGCLVCPWHGLSLSSGGMGKWRPFEVHDDGVLLWVRIDDGSELTDKPFLPPRPERHIAAAYRFELACDPDDVIANRLDPWHGSHLHPHSFAALTVLERSPEILHLRVSVRVVGSICADAEVTFHCPDARTIVMTIVAGEGVGSVLETHVTPIAPGRTAVIENVLATSDRVFFKSLMNVAFLRRWMQRRLVDRAKKLWVEDSEYAERRYALRQSSAQAT